MPGDRGPPRADDSVPVAWGLPAAPGRARAPQAPAPRAEGRRHPIGHRHRPLLTEMNRRAPVLRARRGHGGEEARGSDLAATVTARAMGEARPGRPLASLARARRARRQIANRDLNCPRGVGADALVHSTSPLSRAHATGSSRPVPIRPGWRGESREQSREHRDSGPVRSRTSSALRSPRPGTGSAGRARQGRSSRYRLEPRM